MRFITLFIGLFFMISAICLNYAKLISLGEFLIITLLTIILYAVNDLNKR